MLKCFHVHYPGFRDSVHADWTKFMPKLHSLTPCTQFVSALALQRTLACWNGMRKAPTLTYGATRHASNWLAAPMSTPAKRGSVSLVFRAVADILQRQHGPTRQWLLSRNACRGFKCGADGADFGIARGRNMRNILNNNLVAVCLHSFNVGLEIHLKFFNHSFFFVSYKYWNYDRLSDLEFTVYAFNVL